MDFPIVINGVTYPNIHVANIKRSFQVLDSELTGRLDDGDIERDIIGTYYNYAFEVDADDADPDEYDDFYHQISAPVPFHELIVPFAQTTMAFKAYSSNGTDELKAMFQGFNRWGGLTFNAIAKAPQRTPT